MERFFENVFSGIGITDIVDILIVAFVIYKLLGLIKQTRAEQLLKGAEYGRKEFQAPLLPHPSSEVRADQK